MARQIFADRVLISDEELDLEFLQKTYAFIQSTAGDGEEGVVDNTPPEDTKYRAWQSMRRTKRVYKGELRSEDPDDVLFHELMEKSFIPVLPDHNITYSIRAHEFEGGGKMTFHCDGGYSIAVTIYLTEVKGGELEIRLGKINGVWSNIVVETKPTRAVILKCDTQHRVLDVIEGVRKSIQIFITYEKQE